MMSTWQDGQRPITLAILAMGGEGGGVLADWIVHVARAAGYVAQNTSVAGVAQRTGATVYYVEMYPPLTEEPPEGGRERPVLSLFPTPGEVDIVIASELMECGRAIQRGFSTPDRTTLITSTNRVYSIDERKALGDGRVDSEDLLAAARVGSRRLVAADFMQLAEDARSVISAALFGALAGSEALPFTREQFEAEIRSFGKGVEASLRAFEAGHDAARTALAQPQGPGAGVEATVASGDAFDAGAAPAGRVSRPVDVTIGRRPESPEERKEAEEARRNEIAATDPASLVGPGLRAHARRVLELPAPARSMLLHGLERTAVYQGPEYADLYLERLGRVAAADSEADGAARLTTSAARHVALWMCYQDTIQVALQKTRQARLERVRAEARAEPEQLIQVREYLHPQIDEITDTMPTRMGRRMRDSKAFRSLVERVTHKGMVLNTTSVTGYTMLTTMARMRPLRPRSLRYQREQEAIEAWLGLVLELAPQDYDLAVEVLECQQVLKGYGATHEHGSESFDKLMTSARSLAGQNRAAAALAQLRSAALADEDGTMLQAQMVAEGV